MSRRLRPRAGLRPGVAHSPTLVHPLVTLPTQVHATLGAVESNGVLRVTPQFTVPVREFYILHVDPVRCCSYTNSHPVKQPGSSGGR